MIKLLFLEAAYLWQIPNCFFHVIYKSTYLIFENSFLEEKLFTKSVPKIFL